MKRLIESIDAAIGKMLDWLSSAARVALKFLKSHINFMNPYAAIDSELFLLFPDHHIEDWDDGQLGSRLHFLMSTDTPDSLLLALKLIDQGLDLYAKNDKGETPPHEAAYWNQFQILSYMIKTKRFVNQKDNLGQTPLHCAASQGSTQSVEILINEAHLDVFCRDNNGKTPLQLAAENGFVDTVEYFLNQSGVKEQPDIGSQLGVNNRLLLKYAMAQHNQTMVDYLKSLPEFCENPKPKPIMPVKAHMLENTGSLNKRIPSKRIVRRVAFL